MTNDEQLASKLRHELSVRLGRRVVIMGVGNSLLGDDGFGPHLAGLLQGKVAAQVVNCEVAPENFFGPIVALQPDTIVILDSALAGREGGQPSVLDASDLGEQGLSTHDVSIRTVANYLETRTGALVFAVCVEPVNREFGCGLSQAARRTAQLLADMFCELLPHMGPPSRFPSFSPLPIASRRKPWWPK